MPHYRTPWENRRIRLAIIPIKRYVQASGRRNSLERARDTDSGALGRLATVTVASLRKSNELRTPLSISPGAVSSCSKLLDDASGRHVACGHICGSDEKVIDILLLWICRARQVHGSSTRQSQKSSCIWVNGIHGFRATLRYLLYSLWRLLGHEIMRLWVDF
jgi:hypothetical protein